MNLTIKWFWIALLATLIAIVAVVSPPYASELLQRIEAAIAADAQLSQALPQLSNDYAEVAQGESVAIDVLANDTALGGQPRLLTVGKPDVGTVSIANGRAVFVAPQGFQGTARFAYMAKGNTAGPPGRAQVTVAVGTRMRIQGSVFRARQDGAQVTLKIGGRQYATTTDPDRGYAFDVLGFNDADIAVLEADGVEADSRLHLESYLGSVGRIKQKMGADGVLTRGEAHATLISFLSSALMIHAVAANDGQLPASDAAYEAAVLSSNQNSMLETASFMQRVDAGQYKLRDWTSSVYAFVSQPGAVWAYRRDEEEQQYGIVYDHVISENPEQLPAISAEDFSQPLTFFTEPLGGGVQDSIRVVFLAQPQPDGRVDFIDGIARPLSPLTLSAETRTQLAFVPGPGKYVVRELNVRVNGALTKQLSVLRRRVVHKLFDGELADLYFHLDTVRTEFPSFPERDFDGAGFGRFWVAYRHLPQIPYTSADAPKRAAMAYFCARPTLYARFGYCDYQIHRLMPNGQGTIETAGPSLDGMGNPQLRATGGEFGWSIDADGRLVTTREGTTMTHQRLAQENGVAEGVLSVGTSIIDGVPHRIAHFYQAVRLADTGGSPVPAPEMTGQWESSFSRLYPLDITRQLTQAYRFDQDGTGAESGFELDERYVGDFAWNRDTEGLLLRRFLVSSQLPDGTFVISQNSCQAPSGNCRVRFQRWIPLAYANGKAYFQEEIYESTSFPAIPLSRTATRPTAFYKM
jgi:hypothetical protein